MIKNETSKKKEISELIGDSVRYLKENLLYSQGTIIHYRNLWERLRVFMEKNAIKYYTPSVGDNYLEDCLKNVIPGSSIVWKNCVIRSVRILTEYFLTQRIKEKEDEPSFESEIGVMIARFISNREKEERLSCYTIKKNRIYLLKFLRFVNSHNIANVEQIDQNLVVAFLQSLDSTQISVRYNSILALRLLFRFAYEKQIIKINLARLLPADQYKKRAKLPSVYDKDEIGSMLASIDRSNGTGKRDYAILMILSRLGLRASDVCNLKFENILWENSLLSLYQYKTGKLIELPLLPEIGEALIEYLKFGRPVSSEPYVFLLAQSPFCKTTPSTINSLVNRAMNHAGINTTTRKHGSHALRHSLASILLKEQVVLPVISEVLGHSSSESTKVYLKIDEETLRQCALDVPEVSSAFYNQKGGSFYE